MNRDVNAMAQLIAEHELQLARQHHQAGRLPLAEQIYRRILSEHRDHPEALHLLGVIAFQAGRPDTAIQLIQRAIAARQRKRDNRENGTGPITLILFLSCAARDRGPGRGDGAVRASTRMNAP